MSESRLQRTRAAYDDPINRLARFYLQHAGMMLSEGRVAEALAALNEAERILGHPLVIETA